MNNQDVFHHFFDDEDSAKNAKLDLLSFLGNLHYLFISFVLQKEESRCYEDVAKKDAFVAGWQGVFTHSFVPSNKRIKNAFCRWNFKHTKIMLIAYKRRTHPDRSVGVQTAPFVYGNCAVLVPHFQSLCDGFG